MRFDQLTPGQLARVPRMHARRGEQPPPIVVIESQLKKCGLGDCLDWEVTARDPETGREHVYHRPPGFDVELWGSPASPSTSGHCTRCHGLEDGPCEAAAGGHGAFNCPGCIAQEASR